MSVIDRSEAVGLSGSRAPVILLILFCRFCRVPYTLWFKWGHFGELKRAILIIIP